MVLHRVPSYDDTLAGNSPAASAYFESFPPLFITRSNVLNTPSLRLEPILSKQSDQEAKGQGSRRWFILSLSCLLLFGNYFAYDNPAALNTQLQKYLGMPYNDYQYLLSMLYSVYSLPNTILPFLFGSLVDRFGPQRVLLVLSSCVCIGQAIFSIGVQTRQVWMMLLGRTVFGIGGESCGVAQASITTMQFRGHELAFALGLNLCIARFGSVVNAIVTPWAEQKWDVPTAVWIGTLSCFASFLSAVALVYMISQASTPVTSLKEELEGTPYSGISGTSADDTNNGMYLTISPTNDDNYPPSPAVYSSSQSAILQRLPGILRRERSFADSVHSVRFTPGLAKSGTRPSLHIITDRAQKQESWWEQWWSDLKFFPSSFWWICILTVLLYGTVVPFNNIASDFLQSKWYYGDPRMAAAVMGIPDTIGAILVPGFGLVVDRYGRRASTLIVSAFIMVVVHATLGFTMLNPIFAFSLLGIAYSMYGVALWPSIACVVTNELHLGKGYGISSSFLNISLTLVPPIVATIRVLSDSFIPVEMFFISMGLCGIIVGFVLKGIDRRDGGALEVPEIEVDVPVIVPQSTTNSAPASALPSPGISQRRHPMNRKRPTLDALRTFGPDVTSDWALKRWQDDQRDDHVADEDSSLLSRNAQENDDTANSSQWNSPTIDSHPAAHAPGSSTLQSPATDRIDKPRQWFSRPLLRRALTRTGSSLLQHYPSGSRYGSVSSPSIVSSMADGCWDIEEGTKAVSGMEDYSVSQYPILYNPLRGSSGSFRVSHNARPIAFGEGEEGCIYLDGLVVEPGHEGHNGVNSEPEDSSATEQDTTVGDDHGREDMAATKTNDT